MFRSPKPTSRTPRRAVRFVNEIAGPEGRREIAIVGATLIDGRGGAPVRDAVVIISGNTITAAGPRSAVPLPPGGEVVEAGGLTLLPGLIDSHFHIDGDDPLPALFLTHGITSVRDPGQWATAYTGARQKAATAPIPRLYLTGPHLDSFPPAYPIDSFIVRDQSEARRGVARFIADEGASAIKVYFRLPLGLIEVVVDAAHAHGIPVTAHLEIVDAVDAIRAGVDGVEHVTSFGTALLPLEEAEKYRQAVLADNNARREGRYAVWSKVDLASPRALALYKLLAARGTYISATLAVFERRAGDKGATGVHVRGFKNMLDFIGRARRAGARIVVGSHSGVPHAARGWAYQRELELLVESGLTPMEAIVAGTLENARFLRIEDRLGTIERGKLADLILIEGDPLRDIGAMRRIKRVMLNGRWIETGGER